MSRGHGGVPPGQLCRPRVLLRETGSSTGRSAARRADGRTAAICSGQSGASASTAAVIAASRSSCFARRGLGRWPRASRRDRLLALCQGVESRFREGECVALPAQQIRIVAGSLGGIPTASNLASTLGLKPESDERPVRVQVPGPWGRRCCPSSVIRSPSRSGPGAEQAGRLAPPLHASAETRSRARRIAMDEVGVILYGSDAPTSTLAVAGHEERQACRSPCTGPRRLPRVANQRLIRLGAPGFPLVKRIVPGSLLLVRIVRLACCSRNRQILSLVVDSVTR